MNAGDSVELMGGNKYEARGQPEGEIRVFLQFFVRRKSFFELRNYELHEFFFFSPTSSLIIEDWEREGV